MLKHTRLFYYVLIFSLLFNIHAVNAQSNVQSKYEKIELKEYYDNFGIIFSQSYPFATNYFPFEKRYTPSKEDIEKGESILSHLVSMMFGNYNIARNFAVQKLRVCHRQYVGFINEKNEKLLFVEMVDLRDEKAKYLFDQLYTGPIMIFDAFTEYYRCFIVNLDTKELDPKSDPLIDEYWFIKSIKKEL